MRQKCRIAHYPNSSSFTCIAKSKVLPSMIIQIPVENALKYAFVEMKETEDKPLLDAFSG